jgi:hypothetical protein
MDISEISKALNGLQFKQSDFEFENFFIEATQTHSRQLVAVMVEIERLHAEQMILSEKIKSTDSKGTAVLLNRELNNVKNQYDRLVEWYDNLSPADRKSMIANFENEEPAYWANYLGRQAALEILTVGRTVKQTMDMMSNLPVDEFEEAVRICARFANLIKDTTTEVESGMGININGVLEG